MFKIRVGLDSKLKYHEERKEQLGKFRSTDMANHNHTGAAA